MEVPSANKKSLKLGTPSVEDRIEISHTRNYGTKAAGKNDGLYLIINICLFQRHPNNLAICVNGIIFRVYHLIILPRDFCILRMM